jgi:hypothetical protein
VTTIDRIALLASDPRVVDYVANVAGVLGDDRAVVIVDDVTGAGDAESSRRELAFRGLAHRDLSDVLRTGDRYRVAVGQGKTVLGGRAVRALVPRAVLRHSEAWTVTRVTPRTVVRWAVTALIVVHARTLGRLLERSGASDRLVRTTGRRFSATAWRGPMPPLRDAHAAAERVIGDVLVHFPHGVDVRALRPGERDGPQMWHVVLCHGPVDADDKMRRWGLPTVLIGYPRYAHLRPAPVVGAPLGGSDRARRTVLWLPTAGSHRPGVDNTIEHWLDAVAALTPDHHVVVRPHPKDVTRDPTLAARLAARGLSVDTDPAADVGAAIAAADVVLCDHGGPIFSTVYLDRPLVLLAAFATGSPEDLDRLVRRDLVSLGLDDADPSTLMTTLSDEARWADQAEARRRWRERLFGGAPADGAVTAAEVLDALRRGGVAAVADLPLHQGPTTDR